VHQTKEEESLETKGERMNSHPFCEWRGGYGKEEKGEMTYARKCA